MKSRNVIISLAFVLVLFVFAFMKFRYWEPKKKLVFRRNPSRIEYSQPALCHMDCYHVDANDITAIIRKGVIDNAKAKPGRRPCPVFVIKGTTASGINLSVVISQCGSVAHITACYSADKTIVCNCNDGKERPISYFKKEQ